MVEKDANGKTLSTGSRAQIKDMTGMKFGRLTVMVFDHADSHGNAYWKCECECGNTKLVQRWNLLSGNVQSCGCLNKEKLTETKHYIPIKPGTKFGMLTTTGNTKQVEESNGKKNQYWECECECGNKVYVRSYSLKSGHTQSCGCMHSKMEYDVNKWLNERNEINHTSNIIFDDLKLKSNLVFDFGLYDKKWNLICLIECQGMQHFQNNTEFGKDQREITDVMKKEYCENKKIPLYYIMYNADTIEQLRTIYDNAVRSAKANV